jgi:predicted RNA-binding protein with PIN domain
LDRSLEAAREALVGLCRAYRARRRDIERLYIVFDGDEAYAHRPEANRGAVTVLFTQRQEEADDRILSLIRADTGCSRFIIVSNDTYVFNNARAHGARVMPVHEFYAQCQPASASRPTHPDAMDKTTLSALEARRITEEYRKHLEGSDDESDSHPSA